LVLGVRLAIASAVIVLGAGSIPADYLAADDGHGKDGRNNRSDPPKVANARVFWPAALTIVSAATKIPKAREIAWFATRS
jgi:hypothetical protein